ncbi:MAG: BPSS1187 family protein, partial [Acidimicrobiales bacterium]
ESVNRGYHAIGVNYPNSKAVGGYCGSKDTCYEQVRREIVYGNTNKYDNHFYNSGKVDVAPDNSIVGQLTQKLAELSSNPSWAQFLPGGRVDWTRVIVTGHSQGAGHAAILGIDQSLARVGLLAGPNDDIGNETPPSYTKAAVTTPEDLWYGLAHDKDKSKGKQLKAWDNLFGFGSNTVTGAVPTGAHRLITTLSAPDDRYHESVVVDQYLNLTDNMPTLIPSWDSLLGTVGSGPTTVATPTISPNGGTFTTSQSVTLATTPADATIRYTINNTDPTETSTIYGAALTITDTTTVKAKAFKAGLTASGIATATFTKSSGPGTGPQFQSSATATGIAVNSVSLGRPPGTATGDFLLAAIRQKKSPGIVTAPAGWTLVREDGIGAKSSLFWRIAGSEPGPYVFAITASPDVEAHILRFSGVDNATPIAADGVGTNSTSTELGTTVDGPSLTAPAGSLYVAIWSAKSPGLTVGPAPGTTEHTESSSSTTLATASEARSGDGATGVRTATLSSSSERRIGQAVVLRSG